MKRKLPKSVRKFIRKEKARIRREILDIKEQNNLIAELYEKIDKKRKKIIKNFQKENDKLVFTEKSSSKSNKH